MACVACPARARRTRWWNRRYDDGGENRTSRSYRLLPVVTTALLVGVGIMLVIYLIARG